MADPDVEVRVDPGPGENGRQLLPRPRARVAHRDGPQIRVRRQAAVEGAQERPSPSLEVFPGVLTVQDHEDGRLSPAGTLPIGAARLRQPLDEVRSGSVAGPPGIREADQIR
jgi:hypothetical protein